MLYRNYHLKNLSFRLIIYVLLLTIIGILIIGSAEASSQKRQIVGLIFGLIIMIIASLIDYTYILQFHWFFYILNIIFLFMVLLLGHNSHGAKRWIKIGVRFQPSELAKILLVLFFAWFLAKFNETLNTYKILSYIAILSAIPLFLILKEPDLSTTIVTFMVIVTMVFIAGLSKKIVKPVATISLSSIALYILFVYRTRNALLPQYQAKRILSWLHPEDYPKDSYQQKNSIMAIGSGLLTGKGLNTNSVTSVKNGNYIPEPQTDFIFAVAGEEMGYIGSFLIITLMFLISFECILIAKKTNSLSGSILCVGIASIVSYQSFVNICVVTGMLPNTGLTLPFVSYGLTSLITLYLGIGIVLNVSLQSKRYKIDHYKRRRL